MMILLLLCLGLDSGTTHLEPLPLFNGEATNGENWGWMHPESRGGGSLKADGPARFTTVEDESDHHFGAFADHVVALDAGATAITEIEDAAGAPIPLVPGATYELSWSQGAIEATTAPIIAVHLLNRELQEVPGTRTVNTCSSAGAKHWSRQRLRFTLPDDVDPDADYMIAFQNLARTQTPTDSIGAVDKLALAQVVEDADGFQSLFNGRDLTGWTGALKGYRVNDGAIELDPTSNAWGNLYTEQEFDDFIFRFEFKLTPGANNGIGIRAPLGGDAAYQGMEVQVLENTHSKYAGLKPWQFHGSIYGIAAAELGYQRPPGEWNHEEILVRGRQVRITLNGHVILDTNLDEATKNGTLSGRDHPGLARTKGHVGFCGHGDEVAFRNIRISRLAPEKAP